MNLTIKRPFVNESSLPYDALATLFESSSILVTYYRQYSIIAPGSAISLIDSDRPLA